MVPVDSTQETFLSSQRSLAAFAGPNPHTKSQLLKQLFTFPKLPQPYLPDHGQMAQVSQPCIRKARELSNSQRQCVQEVACTNQFSAHITPAVWQLSISVSISLMAILISGRKLGIVLAHLLHHSSKFCATHPAFRYLAT